MIAMFPIRYIWDVIVHYLMNVTILSSCSYYTTQFLYTIALPNQELSGAKSELQGETGRVCSSYRRGGRPAYNSALRDLQMCLLVHV